MERRGSRQGDEHERDQDRERAAPSEITGVFNLCVQDGAALRLQL
jgi:hypothetical protein